MSSFWLFTIGIRYYLEAWYDGVVGKRGAKPKGKVKIEWSPEFAYAIGLITSDGNLSPNGRTINFTSKDLKLVELFQKCLGTKNKVGRKARGGETVKKYYVVQIGDVLFYRFLETIGLTRNKSKTLKNLIIPDQYFFDFLRGHFDGDGTFYSYWDPRWRSSYMFYTEFLSASKQHIDWLREKLNKFLNISGHITTSRRSSVFQLKYAKAESLKLFPKLYYNVRVACLSRKRTKIGKALQLVNLTI